MKYRSEGNYIGNTDFRLSSNGLILTITEYTQEYVDWHSHENPHFTLILQGVLNEENQKKSYSLGPNHLLFHNLENTHRNTKPPIFSRGAHLEINQKWLKKYDISIERFAECLQVSNPLIRNTLFKIFVEGKIDDSYRETNLDLLTIDLFDRLDKYEYKRLSSRPSWLLLLEEYISDNLDTKFSLKEMSTVVGVHPVHISRVFHKYYKMTFGQYCRETRLNRVIADILIKKSNLTEIAHKNNYFDQSHMTGSFKKRFNVTPRKFASLIG